MYAAYTLNRTPTEDEKSPFELRYGRKPKVSHLRPFGNPCVIYRKRTVAGKIQDAGVKGTFLGYGYVSGKKGYRVRICGTNSVTTTRDVGFCAFESRATEVQILPGDSERTPDAVITEPANAADIDARLNRPVSTSTEGEDDEAAEVTAVITEPANAGEIQRALENNQTYRAGAKVEGNWRGHGSYYPAVVTEVHEAGTNGSRNTYDLVYECDGEVERNVSSSNLRTRRGNANANVSYEARSMRTRLGDRLQSRILSRCPRSCTRSRNPQTLRRSKQRARKVPMDGVYERRAGVPAKTRCICVRQRIADWRNRVTMSVGIQGEVWSKRRSYTVQVSANSKRQVTTLRHRLQQDIFTRCFCHVHQIAVCPRDRQQVQV